MWANERLYDAAVLESAGNHRPPGWSASAFAALIKAHIGVESSFQPDAFNPETQLKSNDPSRGLGQIRYSTAQDLGFMGNPEDLYTPELNIELMAQLIQRNLAYAHGALEPAISAYNAGFGNPPNPAGRLKADGHTFINQGYVDSVKSALNYFLGQLGAAAPLGTSSSASNGKDLPPAATGCLVLFFLASTLTGAVYLLVSR